MHAAVLAVLKSFILVHAASDLSHTVKDNTSEPRPATGEQSHGARALGSPSHRGSPHGVLSVDPPQLHARVGNTTFDDAWVTAEVSPTGDILQRSSDSGRNVRNQPDAELMAASMPEEESDERMIRRDIASSKVEEADRQQVSPLGWHAHSTTTTHEPKTTSSLGHRSWSRWAADVVSFRRLSTDKLDTEAASNENRFKGAEWLMLGISVCVVVCLFTQKEIARKELRIQEASAQENRVRQAKRLLAQAEVHAQHAAAAVQCDS
mmetsp:Transcript_27979/g.64572  ORF Transcript_27979/g.64572 Transcript_27979/m.64572 type:complete len:264 (+) Transcript_27979:86-877(+)